MLFAVFKIVAPLAQPGVLLLLIGMLGLALARRRRRGGLVLVGLSLGGFALILVLPLHQWLLLPLEDRFPRPAPPAALVDGIVLLGGAEEVEITEARGVPSFNDTMETVTEFLSLARRYPVARLAFAGGSGVLGGADIAEAEIVRRQLAALGLDRPVLYEQQSRDTYENAVELKRLAAPAPGSTWLLVTAASHMPRSVGAFRAAGWPVVAWPAAYKSAATAASQWRRLSLGGHLAGLDTALHEWEGLLVYRLLGRTRNLFPGPE